MIKVQGLDFHGELRWLGGKWCDKAGHIWILHKDGHLSSKEHGFIPEHNWKIPADTKEGYVGE